jgi:quercetin dioxygenase-like cupin family protein
MNQQLNRRFVLALVILFTLAACNNQADKKAEAVVTTDSTSKATTDTVPPAAKEAVMDAVTVAPGLYKLLGDTMGLKIVEAVYKPGDSSALHSHADYGLYIIEGGTAAFYSKEGKQGENEMKTGSVNIRPAEVHSVKNVGKTTIKVLMVETNRPAGNTPHDAATDPTKVAGSFYKSMRDTLGIRVLIATYQPGQSSAMHSHPDAAIYAISGGTASFTQKDGTKRTNELKTGMTMFTPADTHSVKNVGKTTMKVLIVEVSRPAK